MIKVSKQLPPDYAMVLVLSKEHGVDGVYRFGCYVPADDKELNPGWWYAVNDGFCEIGGLHAPLRAALQQDDSFIPTAWDYLPSYSIIGTDGSITPGLRYVP